MSTSLSSARSSTSPLSAPRAHEAVMSEAREPSPPFPSRALAATLGLGLAVALGVSASGFFAPSRPWSVAAYIVSVTVVAGLAAGRIPALRRFVLDGDVRYLVAPHTLRVVVGALFLVLHARGELADEFAVRAGVGDIAVGLWALPFLFTKSAAPKGLLAWNLVGLLDIVMVVTTAQKLMIFEGRFAELAVLTELPLALVPTMLVPVVLLTHVLGIVRLVRGRRPRG